MTTPAGTANPTSRISGISPAATDEETAAIVAAIEAATPRVVIVDEVEVARSGGWRFSGRWWAKPMAARRRRPYY